MEKMRKPNREEDRREEEGDRERAAKACKITKRTKDNHKHAFMHGNKKNKTDKLCQVMPNNIKAPTICNLSPRVLFFRAVPSPTRGTEPSFGF